jgi:8-oxo-dGTP diphosphatase
MAGTRPALGVGLIVVSLDGSVLLGRRIKAGEPVSWCLPGGHVEAGETFEQAAVREAAEEAGVECRGAAGFALAVDLIGAGVTAGVVAHGTSTTQVREPQVFDHWDWYSTNDLPEPLFPASAAVIGAWLGQPALPGWSVYRLTPQAGQP